MKFIAFVLPLLLIFACNNNSVNKSPGKTDSTAKDPHTLSQPEKAIVKHLDLALDVDFNSQQLSGKASWTIQNPAKTDKIIFDTKAMQIQKVTIGGDEKEAKFTLAKEVEFLGQALEVPIDTATTKVNIYYTTSKDAGALQWLTSQQTSGKQKPFLFTQSQPTLARSWVPSQDGPAVRFTYNATVKVPIDLMAVMSAENSQTKNANGVYHFTQSKPIPSYLMALAVGDLQFKAIDQRSGVYAEPSMLAKAAWEFADMGRMINEAEKLYGPYQWGRYDVLVLPPSFPYGGMENPNLTFATPTVIAGDRSLVSLIAHELAHSWSGNLVTNASWNDMWLNEGFTTYFERRITEAVYGKEEAKMQEVLGRQDLENTIADLGATNANTHLKLNLKDKDPEESASDVAYEKGYAFIRTIEETVGRAKLDSFLKGYFNRNAFQSKTTEQFLAELDKYLLSSDTSFADKIKIKEWVYGPGIPSNVPAATSSQFVTIDSILAQWKQTKLVAGFNQKIKTTNSLLYFIRHLPDSITATDMAAIDKEFKFTQSGNAEVQTAWYTLAIRHKYEPANSYVEKFLTNVGRRKFLRPLYGELIKTPEGKEWAKKIYAKARGNYHPVSYTTIDAMLKG
jgi:leukotriene-A4 hydrolase